MDLFRTAKTVKLRSRHHKYLIAADDEETVSQGRNGSSKQAKWTVEFAEYPTHIVRFKSCFNRYLTATDQHFLLGMTGQKVLQTVPSRVDSSVEWEPLGEGAQVKLKTRCGQFLRANGGLPPWRNSITHDIPHRSATQEWILWNVEVVEQRVQSPVEAIKEIKVALPRYVVFKSKYLSGDSVLSPKSKFAVEVATIGNGQVHVRSCYTNKYLVLDDESKFIVAGAAKPEENTCKDTCTLFEPLLVPDDDRDDNNNKQTIRLRHVQTGKFVRWFNAFTFLSDSVGSIMEVINWDSLVIFPKHGRVAFKGSNGKYLGGDFLQFFSVDDKNEDLASYTVLPASNGNVQVCSRYSTYYWQCQKLGNIGVPIEWVIVAVNNLNFGHQIQVEEAIKIDDPEIYFTPIKIDSNTIAFRSVANNKFLCLYDGNRQFLTADATTLSDPTRIRVEELVMSRSIYNIVYRQQHARIYDETPIVCGTGAATNHSNQEDTMAVLIEYTETKSTSWETSISLSLGVSTTIKVAVPFIADGNINFNTNVTGGYKWGVKEDVSLKMSTTYTAIIGAKKQVKVSYVASKGTCDVPFSYTQEDVFTDGTRKVTDHDDGMFTGINYYNYSFNKQEYPL